MTTTGSEPLRRLALAVLMGCFRGRQLPGWVRRDLADGLGALCLFGSNLSGDDEQARELVTAVHEAGPTCLVALDEEGGDVTRLDAHRGSSTVGAGVLGAADDVALTRAVHAGMGARLARVGVDLDLAPVLDVASAPENPVIGTRSFGADPGLVARHGVAALEGLTAAGVAACAKHYPGHGDTHEDSHVAAPVVVADAALLRHRELVPFAAAVRAGVEAVMSAHVRVPALDRDEPATTSAAVVRLLREELGFDGVLVSDALDMVGVSGPQAYGSPPAAAVASLRAGVDLLCLGADWDEERVHAVVSGIVDAVEADELPRARLEQAAVRVRGLGERCAERRAVRAAAARAQGTVDDAPAGAIGAIEVAGRRAAARAAARALRVRGIVPSLDGAHVVRLLDTANPAVGGVPWGLAAELAALVPGTTEGDASPGDDPAVALGPAAGRPVVLVTRDTHRGPAVRGWLATALAARPDLVVVDLGAPDPSGVVPPRGALVRAYGAGPVTAAAVARALVG